MFTTLQSSKSKKQFSRSGTFAIALRLDRSGADELLRSAGFALSPAIPEDMVFVEAIAEGDGDLQSVSERLYEYGMKAIA